MGDANGSPFNAPRPSDEGVNDYRSPVSPEDVSPAINNVLTSDVLPHLPLQHLDILLMLAQIAINILLNRLKQSLASVRVRILKKWLQRACFREAKQSVGVCSIPKEDVGTRGGSCAGPEKAV